jgi:hypothetical protein
MIIPVLADTTITPEARVPGHFRMLIFSLKFLRIFL